MKPQDITMKMICPFFWEDVEEVNVTFTFER
jgi:hypothetical protein